MPDDVSDIQEFYDKGVEQEVGRLERHQLERDITWRYLEKYLPPEGSILDVGAAAGVYAIPLAKRGYSVTAVDLSPRLMEICQQKAVDEGLEASITCFVADARDLAGVPGKNFDAVLMMGPLYHLVEKKDRIMALREAWEKLKPGGVIFSAFASRYGIWGDVIRKLPHLIERQADIASILTKGRDADIEYWEGKFRAYFAEVSEITPLYEQVGFITLTLAGLEPAADDESYNKLEGERRRQWLDLLFSISTEESIIGASRHLLYIGMKEE